MKKFLVAIFMLTLFAGACFAENKNELVREGILSHANVSLEEYDKFIDTALAHGMWDFYMLDNPKYPAKYFKLNADERTFFDTVAEMIMALNAGKIDRMEMPEPVGKYFLAQDNNAEKYNGKSK